MIYFILIFFLVFPIVSEGGSLSITYNLKLTEPTCQTDIEVSNTANTIIIPGIIKESDFNAQGLADKKGLSFSIKLKECMADQGKNGELNISGPGIRELFRNDHLSISNNTGFLLKSGTKDASGGTVVESDHSPYPVNIVNFNGTDTLIDFWIGVKKIATNTPPGTGVLKANISFELVWR